MGARDKIEGIISEKEKDLKILRDLLPTILSAFNLMQNSLKCGGKILICGNGGSAADAQHFAAELVGRYLRDREALPAIALTTDTSILTALGNDLGFDKIFSRQIEALGKAEDVLLAISTSGNSANVIEGISAARKKKMKVVTLLGKDGGAMRDMGDINIIIPYNKTPRIQELHSAIIHILCELLEDEQSSFS